MNDRFRLSAIIAAAAAGLGTAAAGQAQPYNGGPQPVSYSGSARVISSTPIYERVTEPSQQCQLESYPTSEVRQAPSVPIGTIVGGVAGGVLGHQIGSGRGNTVATIAGAVGGAAIGNSIDNANRSTVVTQGTRQVERCYDTSRTRDVIRGYNVVYRYDGREFSTQLPYDPGPQLRVSVAVTPVVQ